MFELSVARSSVKVTSCQAVRFRVYCRERNYLSEVDYPHETESDEFDAQAQHLAVLKQGNVLGTVRIVQDSQLGFPLEKFCQAQIPEGIRNTAAEVSRLAVPRITGSDHWSGRWNREIAFRLYQSTYNLAKQVGLTHLLAVMEPSLVRILMRFDIFWTPIGPVVDYGGLVRPYLLSIAAFDAIDSPAANMFRQATTGNGRVVRFPD